MEFETQTLKANYPRCLKHGKQVFFTWLVIFIIKSSLDRSYDAGILIWFSCVNIANFSLNSIDKIVAVNKWSDFRVPDFNLHALSLLGGAPSTALSMCLLNHKSNKTSYQDKYVIMCKVNVYAMLVLMACYVTFYVYNYAASS